MAEPERPLTMGVEIRRPGIGAGVSTVLPVGRLSGRICSPSISRITRGPTLVNPQSSSVYRAAADGALRALRQIAPFDVPDGFPGGAYRPTFNTERACRNR